LIVGFIVGGVLVGHGDWGHLASQHGGLANIGTKDFAISLMYVSFAYSGWNAAAYIAGEIEHPARTLPRSLLLGTGVVMVLYVGINLVFFYAVPSDVLAGAQPGGQGPVFEVGDVTGRALFGDVAGQLVTSVIALALVSSVSAMVMAGPRVYAAMAVDHALPRKLATYSKRGVPMVAVITQGVLGCLFVMVGDPEALVHFVGFTLAIFAALTVGSLFVFRARKLHSPYRTLGYPITPIAFIAMSAWIAYAQISDRPTESIYIAAVLGVGGLVYFVFHRNARPAADTTLPAAEPELPQARVIDKD
ncbi:MAG TPA: APC family permease, partial [Kofleriaceae bacterium]